jgi:hypothetical protein
MTLQDTKLYLQILKGQRLIHWKAAEALSVEITSVINDLTNWEANHPPTTPTVPMPATSPEPQV